MSSFFFKKKIIIDTLYHFGIGKIVNVSMWRHKINKELLLNNIRIIKRGYLYDIYAYMSYMTDFELQYKGLDFFKLIDVIRNDYELEDTLIKEVIEFTKY